MVRDFFYVLYFVAVRYALPVPEVVVICPPLTVKPIFVLAPYSAIHSNEVMPFATMGTEMVPDVPPALRFKAGVPVYPETSTPTEMRQGPALTSVMVSRALFIVTPDIAALLANVSAAPLLRVSAAPL
jgi:hypothetical protein